MTAAATLRAMGACPKALGWAETHGGTMAALWKACPRSDWLLWYAARAGARQEDLVRAAAGCAELALTYSGGAREVCEAAIAAARAWADAPGPETRAAARSAAYAAAVAGAAADAAARSAARSAVYAADAAAAYAADAAGAYAAASAAAYAADAAGAYAAASAAAYAADAAGDEMHKRCADVVRTHVPFREVTQ